MFDLKTINTVLDQLEQDKNIPREKIIEAIEMALASAYKKEYGKKGQIINAKFDLGTGATEFTQSKIVVEESMLKPELEEGEVDPIAVEYEEKEEEDPRIRFNPEQHILIEDAKKIKKNVELEEEIIFPLEAKTDFGRIAAQTAKQTIIQKIREAEKISVAGEFEGRQGEIVSGTVQRIERGNVFVDLGRATGILPYEEQIRGERYGQGERVRAYLYSVDEGARGVFLKLSRTHPQFLQKLFEIEAPEINSGVVEIKAIVREPGSRSKVAAFSADEHIDPIGSLVGQRGVRISTIMSELNGEKIDIIEWSEDPYKFIEGALSPAKILNIEILEEEEKSAVVEVAEDQLSLAIGKGGQNVRLAAKLTGWKIDIKGVGGSAGESSDESKQSEDLSSEALAKGEEESEKVEEVEEVEKKEIKEEEKEEKKQEKE